MSELIEIKIPDLGGADAVDITEVLIKAGDTVEPEQTLAIMESDKATMDLPSSVAGTVKEVILKVGDKVSQGTLVAVLHPLNETATAAQAPGQTAAEKLPAILTPPKPIKTVTESSPPAATTQAPTSNSQAPTSSGQAHATPSVRLLARELGVDLSKVTQASGTKGRILKQDVHNFVQKIMHQGGASGASGAAIPALPAIDFSQFGATETRALSKLKRLSGEHMLNVCLNLPMVTQHDEADITELESFRKTNNAQAAETKLTGLVFIIKALVATLTKFPQFNSSLAADGQALIYKKYFNIGIAVETPNGLVVPVIKGADGMGLEQLSTTLSELSEQARNGKLLPSAMQGAGMTISSLGGIGGSAFTPIVNAPEVAILGVSRAKMQPLWNGTEFIPRLMLPLDLSYDHRVIDGAEAARFLVALTHYLGDVRRLLL